MPDRTCSVPGCNDLTAVSGAAKGLCRRHYQLARPKVRQCSIEGCGGLTGVAGTARGWCSVHYQCWQRHGDPLGRPEYVNKGRTCKVDDCVNPALLRGWCSKHYTRWQRYGSLEKAKAADWRRRNPDSVRAWATARYRRLGGVRISALEIADRDGWRCQICGRAVRRSLRWPHPKSLSIDHIVPLAVGGTHEKANVQAAHLDCNNRKKTRGTDQLRLFG